MLCRSFGHGDERDGGFPVLPFLEERGSSRAAAERLLDLLLADGYIDATTQKNGAGDYVIIYDAQHREGVAAVGSVAR